MRKVKKFIVWVLIIVTTYSLLFPLKAEAWISLTKPTCTHNFNNDVCKNCGYLRIHEFKESITFFTIKNNVPIWSKPTKNSDLIEEIEDQDTMLNIDGVLRNQYGNIWLKLSGEQRYVYIDNVYLDFLKLIEQNYQYIYIFENAASKMAMFYDTVKPGGKADYKAWLDPSLKGIEYNVRFGEDFYKITAEQLGNIHYGYLGSVVGFSEDLILYAGGVVNQMGKLNTDTLLSYTKTSAKKCISIRNKSLYPFCIIAEDTISIIKDVYYDCSNFYCDTEDDADDVKRGINYYKTGEFKMD